MNSPVDGDSIYWKHVVNIRPLITRQDDKRWRAQYPELDWYVSADSEQAAGEKINAEALRRLDAGEPDAQPPQTILERHLANPIPGVYALDRELFVYLREKGVRSELDNAFEEAERRRARGQTYTKADYLESLHSGRGES